MQPCRTAGRHYRKVVMGRWEEGEVGEERGLEVRGGEGGGEVDMMLVWVKLIASKCYQLALRPSYSSYFA